MTQATHSLQQRAYEHVREQIATGSYLPGIRLDYRAVGQEIGTSSTPVREAMRRLETEGLVELVPRLGAVVKKLDPEEMRELYGVREAIEGYAARIAAEHINGHQIARLGDLLDEVDRMVSQWFAGNDKPLAGAELYRFLELDWAFHEVIIRASNNSRLRRIVETCHMMSRIFNTQRASHTRARLDEAAVQHHQVLNALKAHDGELARRLIIQHIRDSLSWSLGYR
ncbi:MAG: GntR family transcriptional regulator [Phycisphaeraceae bacterium]|nr:GntR family transcriptional regulator [Phycisphaeraceae bacterium]